MTKNVLKAIIAIFCFSLSTTAVAEDMYKWKDDKGITHYSQTPPQDIEFELIAVAQSQNNSSQYNLNARASNTATPPPANQAPATDVERYNAARDNNCDLAKRNLHTLTTVGRIRIPDGSGGERLLSDKEKAEKTELSIQQVKTFCANPDESKP